MGILKGSNFITELIVKINIFSVKNVTFLRIVIHREKKGV